MLSWYLYWFFITFLLGISKNRLISFNFQKYAIWVFIFASEGVHLTQNWVPMVFGKSGYEKHILNHSWLERKSTKNANLCFWCPPVDDELLCFRNARKNSQAERRHQSKCLAGIADLEGGAIHRRNRQQDCSHLLQNIHSQVLVRLDWKQTWNKCKCGFRESHLLSRGTHNC